MYKPQNPFNTQVANSMIAKYFHASTEKDGDPHELPQRGFRQAFVDGYVSALHVNRIFSKVLFLPFPEQSGAILQEIRLMPGTSRNIPPELHYEIDDYMCSDVEDTLYRKASELKDAFVAGYVAAHFVYQIYKPGLFATGHLLSNWVSGEIIASAIMAEKDYKVLERPLEISFGNLPRRPPCTSPVVIVDDDDNPVQSISRET